MKLTFSLPRGVAILCLLTTTQSHTWLEQLRLIASNGSYVGSPGYPRGFVPRSSNPGPDQAMVYQLPRPGLSVISPKDRICNPSQNIGSQNPEFPALVAAPQDQVAVQYLENGHVTKLEANRPVGGGFVFVYGTKNPSNEDTYLGIHRVWNAEGTGGDKRGKLLATRYYDDGRCYQDNPASQLSIDRAAKFPIAAKGADLSCQTDVQLPQDAGTSGTYTLYWVWEWPKVSATGAVMGNESYTGCVDIKMRSKCVPDAGGFIANQPFESMAIKEQLRTQLLVNPTASQQLNTASIFLEQKLPLTTPAPNTAAPSAAPAEPSAPAPSSPAAPGTPKAPGGSASKSAPQGFITVTVTGGFQEKFKTVTVTDYITIGPSQPTQASPKAPISRLTSSPASIRTSIATSTLLPTSNFEPVPKPSSASGSAPYTSYPAPSAGPPSVRPFLPVPGSQIIGSSQAAASSSTFATSEVKASSTSKLACTKTAPSTGRFTETAITHLNGSIPINNNRRRRRFVRV